MTPASYHFGSDLLNELDLIHNVFGSGGVAVDSGMSVTPHQEP